MNERQERFISLLRQMFEIDKADLDFGIYRILNYRRDEIERFFTTRLPQRITEMLKPFASGDHDDMRRQMSEIEEMFADIDIDTLPASNPSVAKYRQLKQQLQMGYDLAALESDVYSALYTFFSRYYDEGDFISKRRYKEGVYAIPYEGEEVKLYWANQDQYYIKTAENFRDYTFVADGYSVHFRLVNATTEQNNNKETQNKKRQFMLFTENEELYPGVHTFEVEGKDVSIRFLYDVPEDASAKGDVANLEAIVGWINTQPDVQLRVALLRVANPEAKADKQLSVIKRHLEAYVAKNTFDYFIHKDLGRFLSRELDFFIKNEVMHLDDLDTASEVQPNIYLSKVRAIKRVGTDIIAFLAQIEDFQKRLWLKRKFVVETNWCLTLDRVPRQYYNEISKNKAQVEEWKQMYAIHELQPDIEHPEPFAEEPSVLFLEQNQNLILDTKHFAEEFKQRLIGDIDRLDEQTGGLLVHSDNYHALRLLQAQYSDAIKLIYTDPPYNTDASKIAYKNGYENSSWLSLMETRLFEARKLLSDTGVIEVAIDDYELRYLNCCMEAVFGIENSISNIAIFTNPKGRDQGYIAQAHDYSVIYAKDKRFADTYNFILSEEELAKKFSKSKDGESLRELPLKRTGSEKYRYDRPGMFFPFFYNPKTLTLKLIGEEQYCKLYDKGTDTFNDDFLNDVIRDEESKGFVAILPVSERNEYLRWRWGYEKCERGIKSGVLFCKSLRGGKYAIYQYDLADDEARPKSFWLGERYDASSKGTNILESIIPNCPFKYPKSLYTVEDNIVLGSDKKDTVLDFFAGSATTSHAVIDLNRNNEDTERKYILVEMGEYFDSVTKARTKKIIYSPDWRDGKPQTRNRGYSHIFKYIRLEQYEDSLNNIERPEQPNANMQSLFGDDYMLRYMLDLDTRDSLLKQQAFTTPFDYEMQITALNETKGHKVDVCETFNYLIGLTVVSYGAMTRYRSAEAQQPAYEGAVDLVADTDGTYQFRQIEGTLRDGSRALVIWRNITDDLLASNAALDAYFARYRKNAQRRDYDTIYVNGDSNIENLRPDTEHWQVVRTEREFKKLMFAED